MRVAIYARVSSERQEKEHTIGSQLEALRNYAAQNGMELVEEFTDEGYSGARLDRPALDRMRDLAERRGFEVLLTILTVPIDWRGSLCCRPSFWRRWNDSE